MEASQDLLRIVSGVLNRPRIGSSISSADDSKKDMTVLSMKVVRSRGEAEPVCNIPSVRKIETCSALTASPFLVKGECFSMYAMRS